MKTSRKILLSIGAIGAAAGIAGLGTFATFTDSDTAAQALDSGTVTVDLADAGTASNRLTIGADGMVPGDSLQRRVVLTNDGDQNLASVTLTTTASNNTVLTSDGTNGLQMLIEKCSIAWVESTSQPYTYTCAGTKTTVLAERAIVGTTLSLGSMASLTAGGSDDMVVTVRLPGSAGNTFQDLSTTVTYSFNAIQRNGGAK